MLRLFRALTISFLMGVLFQSAHLSHAKETRIKIRREEADNVLIRRSKTHTVKKREEAIGSILKIEQRERETLCWISLRDKKGVPITNLNPKHFRIMESINGTSRTVPAAEIKLEGESLATVLLRDVSGSQSSKDLSYSKKALSTYISRMRRNDQTELIYFSDQLKVVAPFTPNKLGLHVALRLPFLQGGTALFDGIIFALHELQKLETGLKVVVVFTDGFDGNSTHTPSELLTAASSYSIPIFTVGVGEADTQMLQQIAKESGGLFFRATTTGALEGIYNLIHQILRGSYLISFPTTAKSGDEVEIEITASPPKEVRRIARFFGRYVVR